MAERLVVIGGDAAGMSAASQARRLRPDLDIVALEKGRFTSYSACGIPYLMGGDVAELDDLIVRTPAEFRDKYRIDARVGHEVTAIELDTREVEVRDIARARTFRLGFDHLVIGTGAVPARPNVPGVGGPSVRGVQTLGDAADLLEAIEADPPSRVVVVGGGYIGLETAEAFVQRGASVTVVEMAPEVMGTLDPDMGALVSDAMRDLGIDVRCGTAVEAFSEGAVHTDAGDLPADLVILGTGVRPNSGLAAAAGIVLGATGAIAVDRRQRTSAEGVWAAGDCCESFHLVSRRPVHIPLGTVANKQGRVVGLNIGGRYATFPGVVGTAISKICGVGVARTGLNEREAAAAGFSYRSATIRSTTRSGYFPGARPVTVKMVVEEETGRILGGQIVGHQSAAKRIDTLAAAVTAGMTAQDLVDLDLSYAPPFSPLWDPVQVAARGALRELAGE